MRKILWVVLGITGVFLLGGYAFRYSILRWIEHRLEAEVPPPPLPWDAIIVLSGRPFERSLKAAELYPLYPLATLVALGRAWNEDLLAIGMPSAKECEFTTLALQSLCVPPERILVSCEGTSTYEEIQHIRRLCRERNWHRIVIVSSASHGKRIERLARRFLTPEGIVWGIAAANPLRYRRGLWWHSEAGILTILEESLKHWYYDWKGYY
ncbi:MAG: YdcF family protein [Bacteroidia bacterium]|nr:YdcF family protein [Bacteroidia bacterium]MDW8236102.1 YdcF family protein [Bacteroidia bacterium]